jgi:hypothetical protein
MSRQCISGVVTLKLSTLLETVDIRVCARNLSKCTIFRSSSSQCSSARLSSDANSVHKSTYISINSSLYIENLTDSNCLRHLVVISLCFLCFSLLVTILQLIGIKAQKTISRAIVSTVKNIRISFMLYECLLGAFECLSGSMMIKSYCISIIERGICLICTKFEKHNLF